MDNLQTLPITMCMSKAAVAAGTTSTLSSTNAITYALRSKMYSRTALANQATPTLDGNSGLVYKPIVAGYGSVFVIGLTATGAVVVMQGSVEVVDALGAFANAPQFPVVPDGVCPIAYQMVKAGPTAVGGWVYGTGNQSGVTGITTTFTDVAQLPDRPQVL